FRVGRCGRVLWGRITSRRRRGLMMTPLEIKGAIAAVITTAVILVATFTAGGIARRRSRNLELNRLQLKTWQSKDEGIFFKAVLAGMVGMRMGERMPLAF